MKIHNFISFLKISEIKYLLSIYNFNNFYLNKIFQKKKEKIQIIFSYLNIKKF